MVKEKTTKAILFADLSRSTALYEELGDRKAQQVVAAAVKLMTKATVKYQGVVVKTIGDEVMSVFDSAEQALEAALSMQRLMDQLSARIFLELKRPLNIQIGIHFGPVIFEKNDYFGDTVNLAARIVGLAKERQILTTKQTVALLPVQHRKQLRQIDSTKVKGKKQDIEIFEVVWEQENVTVMLGQPGEELFTNGDKGCLRLTFAGKTIQVNANQPSATIGRHAENQIVVNDDLVSRLHARIEFRRGQFILSDQSVNGTYVLTEGDKQHYLRRSEYILKGKGVISVGRAIKPDTPHTIAFSSNLADQDETQRPGKGGIRQLPRNALKTFFSFQWLRRK